MKKLKCVVADDEKLARDVLENYIARNDDLLLIAKLHNAIEVKTFLQENKADILFLDIQMPQLNGLELIKSLIDAPQIVLTTAYSEYAVEAFELRASDYLLKPFSFERFQQSVDRIRESTDRKTLPEKIFIELRVDRKMLKIATQDILYIEAIGNYVKIHLEERTIVAYNTIQKLIEILPGLTFRQIHRSYIINSTKVWQYTAAMVSIGNINLPVGRSFRGDAGSGESHDR